MWTIDRVIGELNKLAEADGLSPVKVPVTINARLTRTLGRVRYISYGDDVHTVKSIEFSRALLESGTDNDIVNVINHEYVHYYLIETTHVNHGHDPVFKRKCAEIGCTHDKTHNSLEANYTEKTQYKYEVWCDECGLVATYSRMGKVLKNLDNCCCGKCGGKKLKAIQNW